MNADRGAPNGDGQDTDQESFIRAIASLRTYLMFVAGTLTGGQALPANGASDLVDSVLADAFAEIRHGDGQLTFKSDKELRSWLVNRLQWTYRSGLRRRRRYNEILQAFPADPMPRTPGSELVLKERTQLLADARAKLDPADRQLIAWRLDEDLTFEEIGGRLGCSASYARRSWLEALERLRSIYLGIGGAVST
jgi:RNA polymerase sigma factor (sigma-70 family)